MIDGCFCFSDETAKYKCNFNDATLIKEQEEYSIHFSFVKNMSYMYLFEEKSRIDLPLLVKTLDFDEESLYVEYSTDGESIIKLMIVIKR